MFDLLAETTLAGSSAVEGGAAGGGLALLIQYGPKIIKAMLGRNGENSSAASGATITDEQAKLCRDHEAKIAAHEVEILAIKGQYAALQQSVTDGFDRTWRAVEGLREEIKDVLIAAARKGD